ncbi:MAG: hypothetical protein KDI74_13590 [Gammaproteobacteria bacterium]|nr:hypothetical protein [Gammaproteobacteria bacterium]
MRAATILMFLLLWPPATLPQGKPQVWGYGVKQCRSFLSAFDGWESGDQAGIEEYLRYRGWLSGLVTGLSLATGSDVLQGTEPDGALRRIRIHCDEQPDDDFFTAAMALIRQLSRLGE